MWQLFRMRSVATRFPKRTFSWNRRFDGGYLSTHLRLGMGHQLMCTKRHRCTVWLVAWRHPSTNPTDLRDIGVKCGESTRTSVHGTTRVGQLQIRWCCGGYCSKELLLMVFASSYFLAKVFHCPQHRQSVTWCYKSASWYDSKAEGCSSHQDQCSTLCPRELRQKRDISGDRDSVPLPPACVI